MSDERHETVEQPVANCNTLNVAKMREALRGLLEIVCIDCNSSYKVDSKCVKCPRVVAAEAAISARPRNCDVLSKDEVLEMLKDRSFSKEDTIEWLYAEAKGETK